MFRTTALVITVDQEPPYGPFDVRLNDVHIGYRAWDGSDPDEVAREVIQVLANQLFAVLAETKPRGRPVWSRDYDVVDPSSDHNSYPYPYPDTYDDPRPIRSPGDER